MALKWARQAEDESISLEVLGEVPRQFTTLSRKLAAALQKVATSEIGRKITRMTESYVKQDKAIPGLVILRKIVEYYSTSRQAEVIFHITDLGKVQMKNSNLENFQNSWEMVLDGMKSPPPEEVLEHFLL